MVELLSLVPSLLIVQFFQRIRNRQQISPLRQALDKIKGRSQMFAYFYINICFEFIFCFFSVPNNVNTIKKKKSKLTFPWWCLFIAYSLSLAIMAVSIFFIIVRGIELGDVKTQKWLTSILTGFFSSILFTQPMKVKFIFLSK